MGDLIFQNSYNICCVETFFSPLVSLRGHVLCAALAVVVVLFVFSSSSQSCSCLGFLADHNCESAFPHLRY